MHIWQMTNTISPMNAHVGCFTETGEADRYDRTTNRTMAV